MMHTEHDNKLNEHLQGSNRWDAVTQSIKMKVVNQHNSQITGTKVLDKFPEARTLPASEILSRMYYSIPLSTG